MALSLKVIVIDGRDHLVGRLASVIAKNLLQVRWVALFAVVWLNTVVRVAGQEDCGSPMRGAHYQRRHLPLAAQGDCLLPFLSAALP
jgi:hypothetical protein